MTRLAPDTVVLHGHELSYVDSGEGPAVLFIHGILGSQGQWAHLVDEVDDDHRVVVPDLFGHGASAKPTGDYSLSSHAATLRDPETGHCAYFIRTTTTPARRAAASE